MCVLNDARGLCTSPVAPKFNVDMLGDFLEGRLCEGTTCRNTNSCTSLATLNIRGEGGHVFFLFDRECRLLFDNLFMNIVATFCPLTVVD